MTDARSEPDPERYLTIAEIIAEARRRLRPEALDYVAGGAESETTLLRNRLALDSIAFRPRVLRSVEDTVLEQSFLGRRWRLPVLLAPVGGLTEVVPDGALPAARAASRYGIPHFVSSVTGPDLADTAAAAGESFIYQLYVQGDQAWVDERVRRAVDLGAGAICITVDAAFYGRRERSLVRRHSSGTRPLVGEAPGDRFMMRCDWSVVDKVRQVSTLPVIVKGIATAEDARLAVERGVDVVYVSNHGGRQLDHGRGAIDILPEVASTVRGKAQLAVDGGFLRGSDVVKALAMGAHMVGLGKLQAFALAADGQAGVERMLGLIEEEIAATMKLLGVNGFDELDGSFLHPCTPVTHGGLAAAFPVLDTLLRPCED